LTRSAFGIAVVLFWGYLTTLALPHATALRNILLYASVLAFAASLVRRELQWPRVDRSVWLLLGYALVAVAAVLVNQIDAARSLDRVRSELLMQAYVLVFALAYVQNGPSPRRILLPLAGGFVLLVAYAAGSLLYHSIWAPAIFTPDFQLRAIVDGYGLNAQFYLPIVVGGLVVFPLSRAVRGLALGAVAGGFALAVWYNTTTAVLFVALHMIFIAAWEVRRRLRIGAAGLALLAVLGLAAVVVSLKNEGYEKMAEQAELVSEGKYYQMLSLRGGIWAIGVECAKDAPWYGYGYNEKKVALVCSDEKYLRQARERGNPMAGYFRKEDYGKVSLHNQYLAHWLESGWLGTALWLAFFLGACRSAWKKRAKDEVQAFVVLPSLVIFLAGCMFNSLWSGYAASKGIMVMLALALAERKAA
jgi:O-antigen ligase